MMLYYPQYVNPIKCWVFFNTLTGAAPQWFNLIDPWTIQTFQNFSMIILHKFTSNKKQPLTTLILFGMRQQEQANMCAYIDKFNTRVVEFLSATPDLLIKNFI